MDKQTITGNGGASYTLTHAVANAQEIEVFVNNVRQEAGVAYTVSGTALTMTGNVASTDDFYVIYQGKALQTTVPPDDSVTKAMMGTTELDLATIKDSTGTNTALTIDSDGRVLTPANPKFSVYLSATSASTDFSSAAGAVPFDTIDFNIGSCVAISSSVATFTAPITGYYQFNLFVNFSNCESANHINTYLQKDGAFSSNSDLDYRYIEDPSGATYNMASTGALIYLTANQTINPMITVNGDTSVTIRDGSRFSGFLVG